jgi:acetylornithine/succinyldiaminopimelate/putrescine aminotransferase
LQARGVLALQAGMTTVRFLPPLVITGDQIDLVLEVVADVLGAAAGAQHG